MKILSLFDGVSVAQQALKELGFKVKYYSSEIDKYAKSITQRNFPNTIQLGDVCGVSIKKYPQINNPDLMILGSPCQDLSIAKKNREGLKGKRSGLFWEAIRIHKEVNPKWFVYENVSSMKKEWKQQMLEAIQVIEPNAYMIEINAALVSAQNRKRVFFTNIPNIEQPKDKGILLKDVLESDVDDKYYIKISKKYGLKGLCELKSKARSMTASMYKGYGNDGVTTVRVGSLNSGGQGDRIYSPDGKSVNLSANGGGRGAKTGLYAVALRNRGKGKKPEIGGSKANAMTTVQSDSMVLENQVIRKLTPIEAERLQSLPDNFTAKGITEKGEVDISNTQRYKALGNAFNCEVIKHIVKNL